MSSSKQTTPVQPPVSIIDAWAQPALPGFFERLPEVGDLFKRSGSGTLLKTGLQTGEVIELMDRAGVEKLMLSAWSRPGRVIFSNDEVYEITSKHPDRFAGVAAVDLEKPMQAVRELDRAVNELGFKALRVVPWLWRLPPNDKLYFPLYAKCVELGIPFCTQVGQTGPMMPSQTGRPVPYLDEVALYFPELKIVAGHIGFPWTDEMIGVAMKHKNVFIDTSAYLPSFYPQALLEYMKTFGRKKVLFGTNFPHLPFERCARESLALDLPEKILKLFLRDNARRVFAL